jgi:hypothetical protein
MVGSSGGDDDIVSELTFVYRISFFLHTLSLVSFFVAISCLLVRALEERGAKEGDLIMIDDLDFDFVPTSKAVEETIPTRLLERDVNIAKEAMKRQAMRRRGSGGGEGDAGGGGLEGNMIGFDDLLMGDEFSCDDGNDDDDDGYLFDPTDFDSVDWEDVDEDDLSDEEGAGRSSVGRGGGGTETEKAQAARFRRVAREAEEEADKAVSGEGKFKGLHGGFEGKTAAAAAAVLLPSSYSKELPYGVTSYDIDESLLGDDDDFDDDGVGNVLGDKELDALIREQLQGEFEE